MFEKILTLCTGNICRSPLAEAVLRQRLADSGLAVQLGSASREEGGVSARLVVGS